MSLTHEVFNQSSPLVDVNLYDAHPALQAAVDAFHPGADRAPLRALGAEMGSAAMQTHARLANTHAPVLHTHDVQGRRIDEVEFHPSYHALLGAALAHGLHGTPWSHGAGGHVERAAGFMLYTEAEPSVLCPVSMTYAVTPSLRANAALHADWAPRVAATRYDARFVPGTAKSTVTMGMGMTEKQGGSDVRANTTRAVPDGSDAWGRRHAVTGHKWFMSAPMCDAFLVLAQGPGGLSCYFVPRFRPDGTLNDIRIQRLKDKLGNHANASSEVEFEAASGWLVGDEGRGVPQILAMGALTRLDCALGTAGLMHAALAVAVQHARERKAFGRRLVEQPLMRNVLADLALESEAATLLAMRLAAAVDRTENGADTDGHEALMRRVLTPIAKFWVCKRGSHFAQEAMECLGGNGYVEAAGQGAMARIYREMPLNSIWEGAGNIQSIDLLRALRAGPVADALMHELAPARAVSPVVARHADALHAALDGDADEIGSRRLARDTALLVQAALLHRLSPPPLFEAFVASRLQGANDAFGQLPRAADFDTILARHGAA
ncbi:MAG: acyl-CoA dehydrogenase family protein [Rubrivivax sp.]|nr:acyl-CoA dehydrogenase family protein [Rubrivivax sp.]